MQTEREREVGELREMKVSIYQQSSVYSVNCSGSSEVTLKEKDNYRFAKKHTTPPPAYGINQLLYSVTAVNQEAEPLPELQPAHSCGLPASVRGDRGLPSGPDGGSEQANPTKVSQGAIHIYDKKEKNISVQTYRMKKSKKCPESFSPGRPVAARECRDGLSSVVYFPLVG